MRLTHQIAGGVRWTGAAFALTSATRLSMLAILARVLDADDFGLIASLTALIGILQTFGDLGLSNAIIARTEREPGQLSSLFWFAQILGIAIFFALWAAAPLVVRGFGEPRLEPLIGVLAVRFVMTPVVVPFTAILQRDLQFHILAALQVTAAVAGAIATVILATLGHGAISLAWGELIAVAINMIVVLAVGWRRWRPELRLRRDDLRGYAGFGLLQVADRVLGQIAMNLDYLLVGGMLGAGPLGVYSLAFELVSMPMRTINPVFSRVAFPVFARVADDHATLSSGYIELSRLLALIQFPILVGIGVLADRVVPAMFGSQWSAAVPLVRILSLLGAFRVICNPAGAVFLAKRRPGIALAWSAFTAAVNIAVLSQLVTHGVAALAWGWVILIAIYWILLTGLLRYMIDLPTSIYLRGLARPLAISAVLAGLLAAANHALASWPTGPALAVLSSGGLAVAGALAWAIERRFVKDHLRALFTREVS